MDIQQTPSLMGADNLPSGPGSQLANEQEVVRKAGRQAISSFLDSHNCFSVLRASGKVVVFDTRIPIQLAFYALVEHGEFGILALLKVSSSLSFTYESMYFFNVDVSKQICKQHLYGIPVFASSWGC
jgi:hypothetical protein